MKTLRKIDLESMRRELEVLTKEEERNVRGGKSAWDQFVEGMNNSGYTGYIGIYDDISTVPQHVIDAINNSWEMSMGAISGYTEPIYSEESFNSMCNDGTWTGGFVEGMGYVGFQTTIIGYNPNNIFGDDRPATGNYEYDLMYKGGYEAGFQIGATGGSLVKNVGMYAWALLNFASAGSEWGDVNYSMIHYGEGLLTGYEQAKDMYEESYPFD